MTITKDLFNSLNNWQKISGSAAKYCYLIYAGKKSYLQKSLHIVAWDDLYFNY
jgi:hypothetical protein